MFRISRRLDYGLQLMSSLAGDADNRPQPTAALAEKLEMPLPFLHQIAHVLMQSGLIKATPGQKGGLRLSVPAPQISVLQIVEALEGPVLLSPCRECIEDCPRHENCATHLIWEDLQEKIVRHLDSIHLDHLIGNAGNLPVLNLASSFPFAIGAVEG
jgi:Rrf2 family protein